MHRDKIRCELDGVAQTGGRETGASPCSVGEGCNCLALRELADGRGKSGKYAAFTGVVLVGSGCRDLVNIPNSMRAGRFGIATTPDMANNPNRLRASGFGDFDRLLTSPDPTNARTPPISNSEQVLTLAGRVLQELVLPGRRSPSFSMRVFTQHPL